MALTNGQAPLYACLNHQQLYGLVNNNPEELLSPEGWEFSSSETNSTYDGTTVEFDPTEDGIAFFQDIPGPPAFGPYYMSITVDSITTGSITTNVPAISITSPGTYVVNSELIAQTFSITSHLSDAVVSNISVKMLKDAQLGPELCANGTFDNATGWAETPDIPAQFGWQISGGKLSAISDANGGFMVGPLPVEEGELYKLAFTVTDYTSSSVTPFIEISAGNFNSGFSQIYAEGAGDFVGYAVASDDGNVALYGGYGFLSLDNVSLKKYTIP